MFGRPAKVSERCWETPPSKPQRRIELDACIVAPVLTLRVDADEGAQEHLFQVEHLAPS